VKIKHLIIENFRNYQYQQIDWDDQINIICGLNAQGKSNLLEAISYLSLATSFRGATSDKMLRYGCDCFFLEGKIIRQQLAPLTITAAWSNDKQRKWKINGVVQTKISSVVGLLHTVIFAPEDLLIIKGAPSLRRRFLDIQMSQLYPEYCNLLIRYNQILRQRNSCLKDFSRGGGNNELLDVWNQQLIDTGSQIITQRQKLLSLIGPLAAKYYEDLSSGEQLTVEYKSFLAQEINDKDIKLSFEQLLQRLLVIEKQRGVSLCGPHRDDIDFYINGEVARCYASQGQQRTLALSLKFAELELSYQQKGEYPVLLLDDVLSELDQRRQARLLQLLDNNIQTFITDTDISFDLRRGQRLIVNNGQLSQGRVNNE